MPTDATERGLERLICAALTGAACDPLPALVGQVRERPAVYGAGWICGSPEDYDREYCVDLRNCLRSFGRRIWRRPRRSRSHMMVRRGVSSSADSKGRSGRAGPSTCFAAGSRTAFAADRAYQNATHHSDRQNARIEHDKALAGVMTAVLKDDTELFRQFMDNDSFKRWLTDTIFGITYDRPTA